MPCRTKSASIGAVSAAELDRQDQALHAIYRAAIEPAAWPLAVVAVADSREADNALLFTALQTPADGGFRHPHRLRPELLARYDESHSAERDVFVDEAQRRGLLKEGSFFFGDELVRYEDLIRTRYYSDVWQPDGINDFCGGLVFDGTDARKVPVALSIYRGVGRRRFDADDAKRLASLSLHVSRALGVMFHLRDVEQQVAATLPALDRLSAGVVLLGSRAQVVYSNTAARASLAGDPLGLAVSPLGDRLTLASRLQSHEPAFRRAIAAALDPWRRSIDHFSKAFVLPTADGAAGSVVHVSSVLGEAPYAVEQRAIVFIYDLTRAGSVRPDTLMEQFDLTRGEARAALAFLKGGTAKDVAARLGVSVHTFNASSMPSTPRRRPAGHRTY